MTAPISIAPTVFYGYTRTVGENISPNAGTVSGTWSGTMPITISYEWLRADNIAGLNATLISGVSGSFYTVTETDGFKCVARRTRATNASGTTTTTANYSECFPTLTRPSPVDAGYLYSVDSYSGQYLFNEPIGDVTPTTMPEPLTRNITGTINELDLTCFAVAFPARTSFGGATLISTGMVIMGSHGGYTAGSILTFKLPDNTEITRTIARHWDFGGDGYNMLGLLDSGITNIDPVPLLYDSSQLNGLYFLGVELNSHLNRMRLNSPFTNNSVVLSFSPTSSDIIEAWDSGKPGFILCKKPNEDTKRPVLILPGFYTAGSAPNVSYDLNKTIGIMSLYGQAPNLVTFSYPFVPYTGSAIFVPQSGFEAASSITVRGSTRTESDGVFKGSVPTLPEISGFLRGRFNDYDFYPHPR